MAIKSAWVVGLFAVLAICPLVGQPAGGAEPERDLQTLWEIGRADGNRVDIVTTAGSWFLYDHVALEKPATVVGAPVEQPTPPAAPVVSQDIRVTVDLAQVVNTMRWDRSLLARDGGPDPVRR
jgi:hypothetical protein